MSLYSDENQVALSIPAPHLNMGRDLLVVIGTCQQQQVMILKHYFYMPSILSRTVSSYLAFMLCLLSSETTSLFKNTISYSQCVYLFCDNTDFETEAVIACVYGNKPYVTLMHHDLHAHPGFEDHLLVHLQDTLLGLSGLNSRQMSVQCRLQFVGMCQNVLFVCFMARVQISLFLTGEFWGICL